MRAPSFPSVSLLSGSLLSGLLLSASLLCACSSEDPAPEPAPEPAAKAPAEPPPASPAPVAKTKRRRTRRRTKKGRQTRKKRAAPALPEGHVYVAFSNADLSTKVLPSISAQAGVQIVWRGEPRRVNLPLKRTLPWKEAMDLVCRFSDTHLVLAYSGRYELRDRYQGQLESSGLSLDKSGSGSGSSGNSGSSSASSRGSRSSGSRRSGSSSAGGKSGAMQTHDEAVQRRSGNEAQDILRGMGTRNSGSRKPK